MSSSDAGAPPSPPPAEAAGASPSVTSPPDAITTNTNDPPVKLRIAWDKDAVTPGGKTSIRVLLDWFSTPANYARWDAGKSHYGENRKALCAEIKAVMHAQGLVHRETANIRTQLSVLERAYDSAVAWLVQNGYDGRIPDAATVAANPLPFGVRASHAKSSNPVEAYVLRSCRYFYVLDSVKRQPLAPGSSSTTRNPSRAPAARTKPRHSWVLKKNGVTGDDDESGGYESSNEAGGDESAGPAEAAYHARNPQSERHIRVAEKPQMVNTGQQAQQDMMVESWRPIKTEQQQLSWIGAPPTPSSTASGLVSGRRYRHYDGNDVETATITAAEADATSRTPTGDGEFRAAAVGDIGCGTATFGVNPPFGGRVPPPADWLEHFPTQFYSWPDFDEYLREFCAVTYQPFCSRGVVTVAHHNRILAASHRGPPVPSECQIYSKQFSCMHDTLSKQRKATGTTELQPTGCTARISAVLMQDNRTQRYYVDVALLDAHNHPVRHELYLAILKSRQMTDPALLCVVEAMDMRGEKASAIVAHLMEVLRETTGETCLLKSKDIHNIVAHLRRHRQVEKQAGETQGGDGEEQSAEETRDSTASVSSDAESDSEHAISRNKRKRVDMTRTNAPDSAAGAETTETEVVVQTAKKSGLRIKLSQLEVLLDVANCYKHMHNEISQIGFATLELLPDTLSGFKHEIIQLAAFKKSNDVYFVLPRYVISGCEAGIAEFCRNHRLRPQHVAMRLEIQQSSSEEKRTVTLRLRQLEAMRRFYLTRHNVALARKALAWVASSAYLGHGQVPVPFDEYTGYTKDLMVFSLGLVPFAVPPVSGVYRDIHDRPVSFTDTIISANIFKFACTERDIDLDCIKATLLGMHSRFHDCATFLNPSFPFDRTTEDRCRTGSSYGAFLSSNRFVAGLLQLRSGRWSAAVLDCSKNTCALYAAERAELEELQRVMSPLFHGYNLPVVYFEAPLPPSFPAAVPSPSSMARTGDSGVLALLFVELTLLGKTWTSLGNIESLDYFRVRYMLQAIQVVTKLNVHEIVWS